MSPKEIFMTRFFTSLTIVAVFTAAFAPIAQHVAGQSLAGALAHKPLQPNAGAPQPGVAGPPASSMTVCQARRTVVTELQQEDDRHLELASPPSNIVLNVADLKFYAEPRVSKKQFPEGTFRIDLKTLGEIAPIKHGEIGAISIDGKRPTVENLSGAGVFVLIFWHANGDPAAAYRDAGTFANALNSLRLYARIYDPSHDLAPACFTDKEEQARIWTEFQKRAAAWRALPSRPALSSAVRKQLLLAEDAVNQKQFEAAAAAYDAGTEIDPMWPEGHFNAAAVYGELKDYDDAVWHMRCYLELLPNAPDAQAARDQMLLWQAKAEQQEAAQ
jgi:hypothetical protein